MKRHGNKKEYKFLSDRTVCPKCGSNNIDEEYVNCLCCRTYEGNGRTCWTVPKCQDCGTTGWWGNSSGGAWADPYKQSEQENFLRMIGREI